MDFLVLFDEGNLYTPPMPITKCLYCGRDTWLYEGGSPVCVCCLNDLENGRKPPTRPPSQKRFENQKAS